jgi:hypothetical protein
MGDVPIINTVVDKLLKLQTNNGPAVRKPETSNTANRGFRSSIRYSPILGGKPA